MDEIDTNKLVVAGIILTAVAIPTAWLILQVTAKPEEAPPTVKPEEPRPPRDIVPR